MSNLPKRFEMLAEVADHLPQCVLLTDLRARRVEYVSPAVYAVFGLTMQEALTDPGSWLRTVAPEDLERARQAVLDVNAGPTTQLLRVQHPVRGQRYVSLSLWPYADHLGPGARVVGLAEDRTDEIEAARHEASRSSSLRQLFACLPDGVVVYREKVLFCNETLKRQLNLDDSVIGEPIADLIDRLFMPEQTPLAHARLRQAATGQTLRPVERRMRTTDGSLRIAELTTLTVEFDDGPARVTVVRDLTERRRLEAQLASADRLSMLGRVSAGLTHELNNPLAVLLGQLELAVEQLPELSESLDGLAHTQPATGELRRQLEAVRAKLEDVRIHAEEAARSARHVRGVMADFRSLVVPGWREPHPVDMGGIVTSAGRLVASQLDGHAQLTVSIQEAPKVLADEARLIQALAYLLVAAAIAVERMQGQLIRMTLSCDADRGRARVRLLAPTELQLGTLLWQTTDPELAGPMGACTEVIESYGGDVDAGVFGSMAGLVMWLPPTYVDAVRSESPGLAPNKARGKVLVIDDDPSVAAILAKILAADHDVTIQSSPGIALRTLLDGATFDAIVCDVMMPEISGLELYETLRRERPEQGDRLVFVTGGAYADDAERRLEGTGRPLLEKPFDIQLIRRTIGALVARGRATPEAPRRV